MNWRKDKMDNTTPRHPMEDDFMDFVTKSRIHKLVNLPPNRVISEYPTLKLVLGGELFEVKQSIYNSWNEKMKYEFFLECVVSYVEQSVIPLAKEAKRSVEEPITYRHPRNLNDLNSLYTDDWGRLNVATTQPIRRYTPSSSNEVLANHEYTRAMEQVMREQLAANQRMQNQLNSISDTPALDDAERQMRDAMRYVESRTTDRDNHQSLNASVSALQQQLATSNLIVPSGTHLANIAGSMNIISYDQPIIIPITSGTEGGNASDE